MAFCPPMEKDAVDSWNSIEKGSFRTLSGLLMELKGLRRSDDSFYWCDGADGVPRV